MDSGQLFQLFRSFYEQVNANFLLNVRDQNVFLSREQSQQILVRCVEDSLRFVCDVTKRDEDVLSTNTSFSLDICKVIESEQLFQMFRSFIEHVDLHKLLNEKKQNALHCLCKDNFGEFLVPCLKAVNPYIYDVNQKDADGLTCIRLLCRHNTEDSLIDALKFFSSPHVNANIFGALEDLCEFNHSWAATNAIRFLYKVCGDPMEIKSAFKKLLKNNKEQTLITNMKFFMNVKDCPQFRVFLKNENLTFLHCNNNISETLIEAVKLFVLKKLCFNQLSEKGMSAFHALCFNIGSKHVVNAIKYLITCEKVFMNGRDMFGRTPLHILVLSGVGNDLLQLVKFFHKHGSNPDLMDDQGNTPLHIICNSDLTKNCSTLHYLLDNTAMSKILDSLNKKHLSPFDILVKNPSRHMIAGIFLFMTKNLDFSRSNALSIYCNRMFVDAEIVSLLIAQGCDVNKKSLVKMGDCARSIPPILQVCMFAKEPRNVVQVLIDKNAKIFNRFLDFGWSLMHAICHSNHDANLFKLLQQKKLNVNWIDDLGRTCLHVLCMSHISDRFFEFMSTVLFPHPDDSLNVNVNAADNDGETAIFKLFQNVELINNMPLMQECVRLFLERNIDFNIMNNKNRKATSYLNVETCYGLLVANGTRLFSSNDMQF